MWTCKLLESLIKKIFKIDVEVNKEMKTKETSIEFAYAWCRINNLDPNDDLNWERAMDWVSSNSVSSCQNYIKEHIEYMNL